jgi:dihydropyrimidinase
MSRFDRIVKGGTVVTAEGSRRADVGIQGETIVAVEQDLGRDGAVLDADGLLVLPGVVDVHTHTRLATDEQPDRFFQDSVAAAMGGTTTFLAFDNPGTGISDDGASSLLRGVREWRERTQGDAAVDVSVSAVLTAQQPDAIAELPRLVELGVPTVKAFMVYDFGVDLATLERAYRTLGAAGGMLQVHCEDRAMLDERTASLIAAGRTRPRDHAASRPPAVEAAGTRAAMAIAARVGHPLYVVHLSCAAALAEVRQAQARGLAVAAETCPHYLSLDESRYDLPDEDAIRAVISPPLRSREDVEALWAGLAAGELATVATDHVPDRVDREKRWVGQPFPEISNGGPGIETLLAIVHAVGVAQGRITLERMVDVLSTTPARLFGLARKGAIEVGRDADLVLFDPIRERTIGAADLHHTSDFTPYEGMRVRGEVREVVLRGRTIVRDGRYVGGRGDGRFVERALDLV